MPRLSRDTWAQIRAEREAGLSFGLLASRYGISKTAIIQRAKAEGWGDGADVAELVRRKAMRQSCRRGHYRPGKKGGGD
jgi:hypothetical protein